MMPQDRLQSSPRGAPQGQKHWENLWFLYDFYDFRFSTPLDGSSASRAWEMSLLGTRKLHFSAPLGPNGRTGPPGSGGRAGGERRALLWASRAGNATAGAVCLGSPRRSLLTPPGLRRGVAVSVCVVPRNRFQTSTKLGVNQNRKKKKL